MTKEIKETLNTFFFIAGWIEADIINFYKDNLPDLKELTLPPVIEFVVWPDHSDTGRAFTNLNEAEEEVQRIHASGDTADIVVSLDTDPADTALQDDNMCIAFEIMYSDTDPLVSANYH